MHRLLYLLFLLFFIWGCVGRDFPTSPVKDIRPNVTTKQEIFAAFGEPAEKGLDTGYETWTYYRYTLGQTIGQKRLHIIFNKDGTVRSYAFSSN
ncbi:MAG: outer membrane protein assembly factor BamE [Candidatus Binatia bacterium]